MKFLSRFETFEVLLEGAAGDAQAPLLVIGITAPGTPPRRQPSMSA
jgi:hypothetical protein